MENFDKVFQAIKPSPYSVHTASLGSPPLLCFQYQYLEQIPPLERQHGHTRKPLLPTSGRFYPCSWEQFDPPMRHGISNHTWVYHVWS